MNTLVIVSAQDDAALVAEIDRVAAYLERCPTARLVDVALTCAQVRGPAALGIVTDSVPSLRTRLVSARARIEAGHERIRDKSGTYYFRHRIGHPDGKLAFLFSGAAGFYPGMLRDLALAIPDCRAAFDELEEAFAPDGGAFVPSSFIFPPAPQYRRDAERFSAGGYAQAMVATHAACAAHFRLLAKAGVTPDGVVGFGGGDLAAAVGAGTFGSTDRTARIRAIRDIYRIVDKAVDHAGLPEVAMMMLVLRHEHDADAVLAEMPKDKVSLATDFSPRQKIFAIAPDFADAALAAFSRAGIRAVRLGLNRPFNTPACEKMVPAIRKFADTWMRHDPTCTAYSCATAEPVPTRLRKAREDVAARWARPVRFAETVRRMYADGYRVFLEVGPHGLLAAAVDDTLGEEEHLAIPLDAVHRSSLLQMQHAVAQLAAAGVAPNLAPFLADVGAQPLDLDAAFAPETRHETEMRLSRAFPQLTLLASETLSGGRSAYAPEPKARGAKAATREAAVRAQNRADRRFESGSLAPLVSDADTVAREQGAWMEMRKTFSIREAPFIADFSVGNSQLSYADPNLKGLVMLTLPLAAEILAEAAGELVPGMTLASVENLFLLGTASFDDGTLAMRIRVERVASGDPQRASVQATLRRDAPEGVYAQPLAAGRFHFAATPGSGVPADPTPLAKPRPVHWSGRDVYPLRLCCGRRLRGVAFVGDWSESGLDYDVTVPTLAGNVMHSRFPIWSVNPLLLEIISSGFALWRSHERFGSAFAFPFRLHRLDLLAPLPPEGSSLKCYLRLADVTPRSQLCDILVSDGNGKAILRLKGWEERVEHIKPEYRALVLQPATAYLAEPVTDEAMGRPQTGARAAALPDIPYAMFARDEEVWLRVFANLVLGSQERNEFRDKTGSAARRTEWLFGRIAAKEAVRRYLMDFHQARWSDADVTILTDDLGKPYAIGPWQDYLSGRLDVAIAHTPTFVVAVAAANARVGVDVELETRDLSAEFTEGAFEESERDLAAEATPASRMLVRFWCAKEAVSKALGTGLRYSPKEMSIVSYDAATGTVGMRLGGGWIENFKQFAGRDIRVSVHSTHDHALAFCFLPEALFA